MSISLISKLRDVPLAVVDVETTGASAEWGDRVIEVGIVRIEGGRTVAEYQQLIDPERRIGPGIVALTGITPQMVSGQPKFADVAPKVCELMRGAVVVGHNVRFDLSFLRKEIRRTLRQDLTDAWAGSSQVMDTVRIARRRFGRGGNGLQRLAPRLGVVPTCDHRALADAITTARVFERLLEPVGGWDLMLCDAIRHQGGPMGLLPVNPRESLLPLELEEALETRGAVVMEYVDARGAATQRVIEPLQVKRSGGELVLVAHCHLRSDRRTFKVDRIVHLTRLDGSTAPPTPRPCPPSGAPEPKAELTLFNIDLPERSDAPGEPAVEPSGLRERIGG